MVFIVVYIISVICFYKYWMPIMNAPAEGVQVEVLVLSKSSQVLEHGIPIVVEYSGKQCEYSVKDVNVWGSIVPGQITTLDVSKGWIASQESPGIVGTCILITALLITYLVMAPVFIVDYYLKNRRR